MFLAASVCNAMILFSAVVIASVMSTRLMSVLSLLQCCISDVWQVSVQLKQYHDELLAACLQLLLALPDEIVITHLNVVIPALQVRNSLIYFFVRQPGRKQSKPTQKNKHTRQYKQLKLVDGASRMFTLQWRN